MNAIRPLEDESLVTVVGGGDGVRNHGIPYETVRVSNDNVFVAFDLIPDVNLEGGLLFAGDILVRNDRMMVMVNKSTGINPEPA